MKQMMLAALLSITCATFAFAQQPENPGFEFWENVGLNVPEPVDWSSIKTSDGGSTINTFAPYVWDQSTDAHTGNYSVKLYNNSALGIVASGMVTNGRVHAEISGTGWAFTDPANSQWNTPLTLKPDSVAVWIKYTPAGSDVAQVKALLHTGSAKIPDAAQTNWIAMAEIDIPETLTTWTRVSAPFNYFNSNTPQYILFVLSAAGTSATMGSEAYFDDLELIYNEPELDLTVFMQGPYAGGFQMSTALNPDYLPLSQPFNTAPWNYMGSESVPAIPNAQVVDWVLVEMRDAATPAGATSLTTVSRKAGFLLSNGKIVDMDGSENLKAPVTINQNLYVVIWHRNHLGIMSSEALIKSSGAYAYNFSDGAGKIYGGATGSVQLETGIPGLYGMAGGDGNADKVVNNDDKINFWSLFVGSKGYLQGDYNMNGQINNRDKNDIWLENLDKFSSVPN
ncbi:MAG: hypothetical protein ACNA7V_04055 [Bacteroidales bacterium]